MLNEKEMRLLVGIVLDARQKFENVKFADLSEKQGEIIALGDKLVHMVNELYPTPEDEEMKAMMSIFGEEE